MGFDMQDFSLAGRTALVIGAGGGIGAALAQGMAKAGARVLLAGRDRAKLLRVAQALRAGDDAVHTLDARQVGELEALAARLDQSHGPVDILVNCQGTLAIKPAIQTTEAEYDAILDTNLKSVYFSCVAFGKRMLGRGAGAIINITSLSAHTGWSQGAAYCASKWGVAGLTQTFAAEWGGQGVRVNAIAPGFFPTELNRERMPQARKEEAARRSAMGRMGEVDELVGAAIYLASPAAAFVNGATLRVDGGYLSSGI
ncbi:SDR family oxidoreductase [Orrella sp. JC864]|uniref:SDR family NAD(P)-dependent oxidoreductase n=1 Tax=Orrella sp. JC864 TaxID=3120298 RepID=UPI00300815EE